MNITGFIAKCMAAGYDYDKAWRFLGYSVAKGCFDNIDINSDEMAFSDTLEEIAAAICTE